MTTAAPALPTATPRAAALPRDIAMHLAATECHWFTEQRAAATALDCGLGEGDRLPAVGRPAVAAHVLGRGKMAASV